MTANCSKMAAEQELLCSACKSPYALKGKDPKTLQCLHTFCVDCLKIEFTDERKPFVSCPAPSGCGARHYLETAGKDLRSELKTDYFLKRASFRFQALTRAKARCDMCSEANNEAKFYCDTCQKLLCGVCCNYHLIMNDYKSHASTVIELEKILQQFASKTGDPLAPFATKKKWKCEEHLEEEADVEDVSLYCVTCSKMICIMCATGKHSKHTMRKAIEVLKDPMASYPDYNIGQYLAELEQIRDNYAAAVDSTNHEMEELNTVWRKTGERIKRMSEDLQQQLMGERDALMKKVENIHDVRVGEITEELTALSESRDEVTHSIEFVKNALLCIPEDILDQERGMIERLEQLRGEFGKHPLEPSQRDVFVRTIDPVDLNDVIGRVYTNPDLCSLVKGIDQVPFIQGKKTKFPLTCFDQIGSSLPSTNFEVVPLEVRPNADEFSVRNNGNGTYTVTLQPHGCGEHSIHLGVQHEGKRVLLDPVTVTVSPILLRNAQVTGQIHCNQIREMISPAGIAVLGQKIAIVDKGAHKLFILTLEGDVLNVIGDEGAYECEFNTPQGVDWWGEDLVVADTGNNRIQILSVEGEFFSEFGTFGGHGGEFMMPIDVAVSVSRENTTLFVADCVNHRIQFFKMTDVRRGGELIGVYKDLQNKPLSLCANDQNRVFVVDSIADHFKILSLEYGDESKSRDDDLHQDHSNRSTPEPREKHAPQLVLFGSCRCKEVAEPLVEVQSMAYDSQTRYILLTEANSPNVSVFSRNGAYVGSVPCPGEGVKLAKIAVFNSCTIAYDSANRSIFVLRLF